MFRSSLPHSTSVLFSPPSLLHENSSRSPTSPAPSEIDDITLHFKPIPTKTKRTEDEKEQRRSTLDFQNLAQEQEEAENHINTDGPWACHDDSQSESKTLRGTQTRKRRTNHLTINTTLTQSYKPYQALPLIDTHLKSHHQSEELAGSSPVEGSEEGENGSPATSPLVVAKYRDEDGVVEDKNSVWEEEEKDERSRLNGSLEGSLRCFRRSNTPSGDPIASSVRFIAGDGHDSDDELKEIDDDIEFEGMPNQRVNGRESQRGSRAVRKCESVQVLSSVRDFADGLLCQSANERDSEDDDEHSIPSSPSPSLMAREIDELDLDLEMDFVVVDSDADVDEDDLEDRYGGLRGVGETKVLTGCVGRTKAGIDGGSLRLDGMVWESVCSAGGEGKGDVWCVRRC